VQLKAIHDATHPAKSRKQAAQDGREPTAEDVLAALDVEAGEEEAE
jgi:hypothetical protein